MVACDRFRSHFAQQSDRASLEAQFSRTVTSELSLLVTPSCETGPAVAAGNTIATSTSISFFMESRRKKAWHSSFGI